MIKILAAEVAAAVGAADPADALPLARSLLSTMHGHCASEADPTVPMLGEPAPVEAALAQ